MRCTVSTVVLAEILRRAWLLIIILIWSFLLEALCNCVLNALIFPHQSHLDVFQRHSINSWNVSDKYRTKIAGNPTWKMHYSELTNWRRANWQTGGGAKSALVPSRNQLHKFWQAYPRLTLPLIPTMYDTWGGTSRILGARGLRKKLSPVEGFRPPTHYVVWVGEPD